MDKKYSMLFQHMKTSEVKLEPQAAECKHNTVEV